VIPLDEKLLPLPAAYDRVLVVTAHPDDAEYSFGASVSRLVAEGSEVRYVVCTDGAQGGEDPEEAATDLTTTRYTEQRAAAAHLGVRGVEFLGFPDGSLTPDLRLRRAIVKELRRVRPQLVLTHQPLRSLVFPIGASHPDHLAVGEATLAAVYPDARNPRAFPELLRQGLAPHRVAEVWVPGHEHTDFYVDVGAHSEAKAQAILLHESQFRASADPRADIAWAIDRMRGFGERAGCAFAEGFTRIVADAHAGAGPVVGLPPRSQSSQEE
jgi:LmbE family N-acetylglucosaminyl deacetylase